MSDVDNTADSITIWALFGHYHPNFAGAAVQGHSVLRWLVNHGFTVTVLAAGDHAARRLRGKEIQRDGIAVRYLSVIRRREWRFLAEIPLLRKLMVYLGSLASSLSWGTRSAWLLLREGRHNDIVQLYICNEFSFLPVWAACVRHMHPVIRMTLMGSDDPISFGRGGGNALGALKLEAFRRAEAIVGMSNAMVRSCQSAGFCPPSVHRIPNGVDLARFNPLSASDRANLREVLGLKADQRYVVFVGSAQARKGIDVLIRAFICVARRFRDVELLIVGPSNLTDLSRYRPTRQRLVNELKKELVDAGHLSRVKWVGTVDSPHQYLQAADIFCLPTRREGLPNAVIEAMAVGLPVVTARLEGVTTDLIQTEDEGLLLADHDPNKYCEALVRLLETPEKAKRMGRFARARALSDFNLEAIGQRYADLYRELAGGANA